MQILSKKQLALLDVIGKESQITKNFYLGGGTALTGFYLHHRYSEDLDFFSEQEFDVMSIQSFFKKNKAVLGYDKLEFQQSFNRHLFFVDFKDETVKMEFTYFPFARIENGQQHYGINVDSLLDIAVNKVFTIYQRTKARDYIDLYCIIKKNKYRMSDLVSLAKTKFDSTIDPILLGAQFIKAKEAPDLPRMIEEIDPKDWQDFFVQEAQKLKSEILS